MSKPQDDQATPERKQIRDMLDRFRVTDGAGFKLKHYSTKTTVAPELTRPQSHALLQRGVEQLALHQEKLYAQDTWSVLCVFQAMDAAGKDGTIKHVMSGVNPQGVQVTSFKAPGPEELDHDFLWRIHRALPERGRIGIFNRSHYEEVLAVRVHPALLEKQRLPPQTVGKTIWTERLDEIASFERYLSRQGTIVLKFFLYMSKDEQKRRLLSRLDTPDKNWKFDPGDLRERGFWDEYMAAYEAAIAATAAPHAPWFVVPADHKWFTRLVVVAAIDEAMQQLNLAYPTVSPDQQAALQAAKSHLESE